MNDALHSGAALPFGAATGPIFVAHNRDGLGERLRAIVNAMVIARKTGGTFRFAWPDLRAPLRADHAIIEASDFFSPSFIDTCLVPNEALDEIQPALLKNLATALAEGQINPGQVITVQQPHLFVQARPVFRGGSVSERITEAFSQIEFSAPIERARDAAKAVDLPENIAAIHLRGGDVIYGIYRTMDDFHGKVISYPLAVELIKRLKAEGATPLVFGQDDDLLTYLRDAHGALCANDLGDRDGFDQAQHALFDICLLGRCKRIFAGSSGFAVLGSWLAQVEIENPSTAFDADEAIAIIERYVLDPDASPLISRQQKAFAARAAFVQAKETVADREPFWRLLRAARDNDPENDFIQFVYAASLHKAGIHDEAEDILFKLLDRVPSERGRIMAILKNANRQTGVRASPYLDNLGRHAKAGHPMAALYCAIAYSALGEDGASEMAAVFRERAGQDALTLGEPLLPT